MGSDWRNLADAAVEVSERALAPRSGRPDCRVPAMEGREGGREGSGERVGPGALCPTHGRAGAGGRRTSGTLGGREGVRNEDSEMVCRFRWATGGHDQEEQLLGKRLRAGGHFAILSRCSADRRLHSSTYFG